MQALGVPQFQLLTGLTGGFGNNVVGQLLPPLLYVKLQHLRGYWVNWRASWGKIYELALCLTVFLLSVLMMVLSTIDFVHKIVDDKTTSKQLC